MNSWLQNFCQAVVDVGEQIVEDVKAAYASSKSTTTPTTTQTTDVWKSFEDAAAAGASNIKTQSEFNRGGKDKNTYGDYQTYLDAMQGKYGKKAETKTYTYDNSNETPLIKDNDPLQILKQQTEDLAAAYGYVQAQTDPSKTQEDKKDEDKKDEDKKDEDKKDEDKKTYSYNSYAQSVYDAQLKAIEEQRAYAEKLAEQARQEAIKNAYINYDRSLSTYGQNAERLAQMGLTNSGYSDYLGGVAYSSMVGGVQDAHKTANEAIERAYYNASQQKAEAADTLYNRQWAEQNEYYNRQLQQQQMDIDKLTAQATKFEEFLSAANYGDYTVNQVQTLAKMYGFTNEQTNSLIEAVKNYEAYIKEYESSIKDFFSDKETS